MMFSSSYNEQRVSDSLYRKSKHILCSITFFSPRKSCRILVWKNVDWDSMAHAHCLPDNQGYKHTLNICNVYCFSPAVVVSRTRPVLRCSTLAVLLLAVLLLPVLLLAVLLLPVLLLPVLLLAVLPLPVLLLAVLLLAVLLLPAPTAHL
jgi:hypothetical protein